MMEAGRELDTLIAEKVMGYVWCQEPLVNGKAVNAGHPYLAHPNWPSFANRTKIPTPPNGASLYDGECYSTSIAAAWEVWDEMTRMRQYDAEVTYTGSNGFCVQFGKNGEWFDSTRDDNREIDGMPFHICLAALKAVGVDRLGIP